jgi:hypothetical protein
VSPDFFCPRPRHSNSDPALVSAAEDPLLSLPVLLHPPLIRRRTCLSSCHPRRACPERSRMGDLPLPSPVLSSHKKHRHLDRSNRRSIVCAQWRDTAFRCCPCRCFLPLLLLLGKAGLQPRVQDLPRSGLRSAEGRSKAQRATRPTYCLRFCFGLRISTKIINRVFPAKNACQAPKRPNSFPLNDIPVAYELCPIRYTSNREVKRKGVIGIKEKTSANTGVLLFTAIN